MASSSGTNILKFCLDCNNLLYPKEDPDKKILLYACRNCSYEEVADNYCVYRDAVHHTPSEQTQELQDVASDPTLPRSKSMRCPKCDNGEAVYFHQKSGLEDEMSTLLFVCTKPACGHSWEL